MTLSGHGPRIKLCQKLVDLLGRRAIGLPAIPSPCSDTLELGQYLGLADVAPIAKPTSKAVVFLTMHSVTMVCTNSEQVKGNPETDFRVRTDIVGDHQSCARSLQFHHCLTVAVLGHGLLCL